MPKFIKSNTIVEVSRHGVETDRQVLFTADEVVSRVLLNPSLVIEVTESHAAQVVRPQQKYQEVSEELLEQIDAAREAGSAKININVIHTDTTDEELDAPEVGEDEPPVVTDEEADEDVPEVPLTFGKKGK